MKTKEILIILLLISALAFTEWNRLKINRLEATVGSQQVGILSQQKLLDAQQELLMALSDLTVKIVKSLKSIVGDNWITRGRSGTDGKVKARRLSRASTYRNDNSSIFS